MLKILKIFRKKKIKDFLLPFTGYRDNFFAIFLEMLRVVFIEEKQSLFDAFYSHSSCDEQYLLFYRLFAKW